MTKRFAAALTAFRRRAGLRRDSQGERQGQTDHAQTDHLPTGDRRPVISVVTWNVHSCVGVDARFSPERTAGVLRGLGADVIGLQEVGWHHRGETGFDQFNYLAAETGMTALAAPTKHGPRGHFGNALLTRFPVREWAPFDLTLPGKEPRSGLDALLDVDGRELRVMVAHLGLTPWERARQMGDLAVRCDARPQTPTILVGDFNEWSVAARRLALLARRLPGCGCPPSFPVALPTLRLDRLYLSPGMTLLSCEAVRKTPTFRASDHLPVVGRVALPPEQIA